MTMGKILLILFLVHQSSAVIYHLNYSEFRKMPDLFQMDDYDDCLAYPDGKYCMFESTLYSKGDSELMHMIKEFSEYKIKHLNHTVLHRAVCVPKTCKNFIQNRSLENQDDLKAILEECVDDSISKQYNLNVRLSNILYCKKHGEQREMDTGDYIMGAVYLILIALNALGTSYDILKGDAPGNRYILAFSLQRNWRKLVAPSGVGPEPRLNKLQVFNGMRTMTMICVIFSHTALVFIFSYLQDPYYFETAYDDPGKFIAFNGSLVTYTFFVMSGFLLAFNFELHAEKHRVSMWEWPKGMLMRWLRLTPSYALIMFTIMTLNRHMGSGPLWDTLVTSEAVACRQYWWAHLLYINNYIYDDSHCLPQTWYLAADTQLFGLGLLVVILFRKPRTQMIALAVMLVISLIIPAAHVYFQDLGAVVHQSPETHRSVFRFDRTFRILFVAGHTNMSTYTLGISGGLLAYHWLKNEKKVSERLQKYPWIMWLTFPVGVGTILSGGLFYMDNYQASMLIKVLYATINKPLFQMNMVIMIMGCIFRMENVYRGILEWRGFTWTGRVSYAAFLLHSLFQRSFSGIQRLPAYASDYTILTLLSSSIFLSFGVGALLFIAVESPAAVVIKTLLAPPKRHREEPAVEDSKDVNTKEDTKDVTTKV